MNENQTPLRAGLTPARVLFTVAPEPGESLLGLVRRTAARNRFPNTLTLTRVAGNAYGHRAGLLARDDQRIADLGYAIGLSPKETLSRAPRQRENGFISYNGSVYSAPLLETRALRFAPAALADSPHHRAIWDCRLLSHCPETWQFLIDACPACGARQNWYHAQPIQHCHACETDLRSANVGFVEPTLREALRLVHDLLSEDEETAGRARATLPAGVAALPAPIIVDLLARMVPAMSEHPEPEIFRLVRRADPARHAKCVAAAVYALRCWPNIGAVYQGLVERCGSADLVARRWIRPLAGSGAHTLLEPLLEAARAQVAIAKRARTKAQRAPTGRPAPTYRRSMVERDDGAIDSTVLSSMTSLSTRRIAELRRLGHLQAARAWKGAGVRIAYEKSEARLLQSFLKDGLAWEPLARGLGVEKHGVEQLASLGLVGPSTHPAVVAERGPLRFRGCELERFAKMLADRAVSRTTLTAPISLHLAIFASAPGLKPWGAVFQALLDGSLPFALAETDAPLTARAWVDWDALAAIRAMTFDRSEHTFPFDEYTSMREVLSELGLRPQALPELRALGISEARGHKMRSVRLHAIEQIAIDYVGSRELAVRTGQDGRDTAAFLRRSGIERSVVGWRRAEAERALAGRLLVS